MILYYSIRLNYSMQSGETKKIKLTSLEKQVSSDTPPAFIWHTAYDNGVHVYNSMRMAEAMRENGIEFALSIFRDGPHGLGLAEDYVDVRDWTHECELWMNRK